MNIHLENISENDFDFVAGTVFRNEDVANLLSNGHNSVDNCHIPSWATKVQDVFEQKAVEYDQRDISEQEFIGVKIISNEDKILVSFGQVGEQVSLVYVGFEKSTTSDGVITLGSPSIHSFLAEKQAS